MLVNKTKITFRKMIYREKDITKNSFLKITFFFTLLAFKPLSINSAINFENSAINIILLIIKLILKLIRALYERCHCDKHGTSNSKRNCLIIDRHMSAVQILPESSEKWQGNWDAS